MVDCLATQEQLTHKIDVFVLDGPLTDQIFTVASGQNIPERAVVSLDGSGEIIYDNSNVIGIMPNAVDATGGAVSGVVYRSGKFNEDLIALAAGTADTVREALSKIGILLEKLEG